MQLLIMAAGMGSRFGGLKQIEPMGPNDEFIIDYSIYDAVKCGFNKIVFIIKEEHYDIFKSTIGSRIEKLLKDKKVKVEYVFQNLDNVPEGYSIPEERVKPLGTAHAILCAKNVVKEPFMIINADDFYGYNAYLTARDFMDNNSSNTIGLVGYNVINTITENGSVKRGICNIKNGYLDTVDESEIWVNEDKIQARSLVTGKMSVIEKEKKVSMNMICFYPEFMNYIEEKFVEFLEYSDLSKDEFLIPSVISDGIKNDICKVKVLDTTAKWVGVTYKEDKEMVEFYIKSLIEDNEYPNNLWNN